MSLTGLAQRRVVSITPIKGVTVIIFEVNLGKYSFDNTAKKYITIRARKCMHYCPYHKSCINQCDAHFLRENLRASSSKLD